MGDRISVEKIPQGIVPYEIVEIRVSAIEGRKVQTDGYPPDRFKRAEQAWQVGTVTQCSFYAPRRTFYPWPCSVWGAQAPRAIFERHPHPGWLPVQRALPCQPLLSDRQYIYIFLAGVPAHPGRSRSFGYASGPKKRGCCISRGCGRYQERGVGDEGRNGRSAKRGSSGPCGSRQVVKLRTKMIISRRIR